VVETFTADTFRPLLNERFQIVAEDDRVDLELVDVTESAAPGADRRAQFSIVFSGPAEPVLPQAIYRLKHPQLGAFELFLVPIAAGSYEAIFN
jgi:hypothetical protein